jgi:hypothetical protein
MDYQYGPEICISLPQLSDGLWGASNFGTQWFPNCFKFVEHLDVVSLSVKQSERQNLGILYEVVTLYRGTMSSRLRQRL